MNSRSITLHDFDIGFVKDFSKIIRITNYGVTLNAEARLAASPATESPACASPSTGLLLHLQPAYCFIFNTLAASPSIVSPALASPATESPACTSPSIGLQFHPQAWARLAASPSIRLRLHSQPACSFTCSPLATSPSIVSPACSNNYFCISPPLIKPFEFFPLNSAQLNSCSIVQLFNCSTVQYGI